MLCSLSQLVSSCNSLRTSPPPAIAAAQAKQAHDDLQRCGRVTYLLRQCVKSFQEVGTMYSDLYQSSFDADPDTLVHIQILQQLTWSQGEVVRRVQLIDFEVKIASSPGHQLKQGGLNLLPNHGMNLLSLHASGFEQQLT